MELERFHYTEGEYMYGVGGFIFGIQALPLITVLALVGVDGSISQAISKIPWYVPILLSVITLSFPTYLAKRLSQDKETTLNIFLKAFGLVVVSLIGYGLMFALHSNLLILLLVTSVVLLAIFGLTALIMVGFSDEVMNTYHMHKERQHYPLRVELRDQYIELRNQLVKSIDRLLKELDTQNKIPDDVKWYLKSKGIVELIESYWGDGKQLSSFAEVMKIHYSQLKLAEVNTLLIDGIDLEIKAAYAKFQVAQAQDRSLIWVQHRRKVLDGLRANA
jgi:hypothetical protein